MSIVLGQVLYLEAHAVGISATGFGCFFDDPGTGTERKRAHGKPKKDGITCKKDLFTAAKEKLDSCIEVIKTWEEFVEALNKKKTILAPWCDKEEVEKDVKARTKGEMGAATTLYSPFDQPELPEGRPLLLLLFWRFLCIVRRKLGSGGCVSLFSIPILLQIF